MMQEHELLNTHAVAEKQQEFTQNNVAFQPAFEKSISEAKAQFAGTNPNNAQFALRVATLLAEYLEEALRNKPAKTRMGRFIRFVLGLIF